MKSTAVSLVIPRQSRKGKKLFRKGAIAAVLVFPLFTFLGLWTLPVQAAAIAKASSEKPLTNEDVIGMSQAGLGDGLVIAKIGQSPREEMNVSIEALLELKKKGLSEAVIEAMVKRVERRAKHSTGVPYGGSPAPKEHPNEGSSKGQACLANYTTDGGFLKGETKRSFQDYPAADDWSDLFDRLAQSVEAGGWDISSTDKDAGTLTGVAPIRNIVQDIRRKLGGGVEQLTLNVTLKKRESGEIRAETALLVPAGTKLADKDAKSAFCRILGSTPQ